jgi:hypothetical protein
LPAGLGPEPEKARQPRFWLLVPQQRVQVQALVQAQAQAQAAQGKA